MPYSKIESAPCVIDFPLMLSLHLLQLYHTTTFLSRKQIQTDNIRPSIFKAYRKTRAFPCFRRTDWFRLSFVFADSPFATQIWTHGPYKVYIYSIGFDGRKVFGWRLFFRTVEDACPYRLVNIFLDFDGRRDFGCRWFLREDNILPYEGLKNSFGFGSAVGFG